MLFLVSLFSFYCFSSIFANLILSVHSNFSLAVLQTLTLGLEVVRSIINKNAVCCMSFVATE